MTEKGKKRENKGQFQKGKSGGPGRPKKKAGVDTDGLKASFYDLGEIIKRRATIKDKDQYRWAVLDLKWLQSAMKYAQEGATGDHVVDPAVQAALGDAVSKLLSGDYQELDEDQDFLDE